MVAIAVRTSARWVAIADFGLPITKSDSQTELGNALSIRARELHPLQHAFAAVATGSGILSGRGTPFTAALQRSELESLRGLADECAAHSQRTTRASVKSKELQALRRQVL